MPAAKSHFVRLPCRASFKKPADFAGVRQDVCPQCGGPLLNAGSAFAAPKRRDTAAWRALTAVLQAGLRFPHGCCGGGPATGPAPRARSANGSRTRRGPVSARPRRSPATT
ncbi:zf-TFIIB domain-containing protein [Streptomyces sp. A3M-1-3]|uniref:TFIIB-type zinc ribbon-containing protein n=1 Tax=Streptomyces sp. A3M-1-3 TaxID=2962044 RepID=UPI0027E3C4AC|nr:zf-TFIIB domain-containing protein [Streptomyces sp. A3M-1-3]